MKEVTVKDSVAKIIVNLLELLEKIYLAKLANFKNLTKLFVVK